MQMITTLFQNFTRMSHTDFENFLELVTPHIQRQDTNYHDSISPRMRLAITLRFLATGDSYKSLMYLFQVSYSTLSLIVPEVFEAISSVLKDYIKNTSFHKALQENQLNIPMPESLPDREKVTPYVFVADDAFALTINFMKPYAGQLSQSPERVFNYRLSRARRIVENVFGIMASVFRVFRKPMQLNVDNVEKITKACVYLHNYLRKSKTSRSLYTPSGSFDNEDLENGTIIPELGDQLHRMMQD
nr:unnamed protein product [Callosobruchus analis]